MQYVDIGLSVRWAKSNLGATKQEESGNYYWWGEYPSQTEEPKYFGPGANYYCNDDIDIYEWSKYDGCDGRRVLEPEDDAATAVLGSPWRMPTKEEIEELMTKCEWEKSELGGIKGFKIIGVNGNSLFLPNVGWGRGSQLYCVGSAGGYWSSSLHREYPSCAYYLDTSWADNFQACGYRRRWYGHAIRPVYP